MVQFVKALRAGGMRVSLAESAEAFQATELMGIQDRESFRLGLRSTLVKQVSDFPRFETLFDIFFGGGPAPAFENALDDLSAADAQRLAEAWQQINQELRERLERILAGAPLSPQELEQMAGRVGLGHANDLRYQAYLAERMGRILRFRELEEALEELLRLLAEMGMAQARLAQLADRYGANVRSWRQQLLHFSGLRIAENMGEDRRPESREAILHKPFSAISDRDMEQLRREVRRLAAILRTRIALRQKRAKNGHLDAKSTLRTNLKHGTVPIEIRHRDHQLKPKLVVLCDVSTSMRSCSELMLSFLHSLQDQIRKTHLFAYIDHLEFISPDLTARDPRLAVEGVLARMPSGYYNTDLGASLENFAGRFLDTVDSRTTFLVVGDGRNNYNDPRLDLFDLISRRSHRSLWLTPEPPALWSTGDSDMNRYQPLCHRVLVAGNLTELSSAVDHLLAGR